MFRCLAKTDSHIFCIFLLFLVLFPCSFVPCRCFLFFGTTCCFLLDLFPFTRPVSLLSFLIKYNIFGLPFIPSPFLPEVDCCCSPLPDFFLSVFCLITSQLLPCNRPFGIIPKSIDKLHRVLRVSTGRLLFNCPIRSVASLDQMCSRMYYTSQTWKKTSSI